MRNQIAMDVWPLWIHVNIIFNTRVINVFDLVLIKGTLLSL